MTPFVSRVFCLLGACGLAITPSFAAAQETKGDVVMMRHGPLPEPIIVEGKRPAGEEEVRDSLRDLAMRGRIAKRPLSKFQRPLCVEVFGLGEAFGQQVRERIEGNAKAANVALADEGCRMNALVAVVKNPDKMVRRIRQTRPRFLNAKASRDIRAAQRREDPVLSWSLEEIGNQRGLPVTNPGDIAGAAGAAIFDNPAFNVPTNRRLGTSSIYEGYSVGRAFSVVIFDVEQMSGVHLNQLADFATMRILAEPQPVVEIENDQTDSIMTLFNGIDPELGPQELTRLDRAYLNALYSMRAFEPGWRLENFVLAAYEDLLEQDCGQAENEACG